MLAHLAYKSNRAYVFHNYRWKVDYLPWTIEQLKASLRMDIAYSPVNAMMAGPAVGDSWPAGDPAPRSIPKAYFDMVCPESERRIVLSETIK